MRAYSESGLHGERAIKLWGNKLISGLDPYHEIECISKAGFTGFYAFFLRPDLPREPALSSTGLHPPLALFQA